MTLHLTTPMRTVLAMVGPAGAYLPRTRTVAALELRDLVTVNDTIARRDPDTGDKLCRVTLTAKGCAALEAQEQRRDS